MSDIKELRGIGDAKAKIFEKKNIKTIEDLLYYFPRTYEDRTATLMIEQLSEGEECCVDVRIFSPVKETKIRKNMTIFSMKVCDDSGAMSIIWYNNRFVKGRFVPGEEYIFFGKITKNRGMWEMVNPIYEKKEKRSATGKIMPIYPLSGNLTQKNIQSAVEEALGNVGKISEDIPFSIRQRYELAELGYALKNIHFPKDYNAQAVAKKRFIFEELYILQMALLNKKGIFKKEIKEPYGDIECAEEFIKKLPFELTGAQRRVTDEILADFMSGKLMTRLVQGDVGSGKTAVAAAAMYTTVKNGYQAAIMAPTEILASQHFKTFSNFFEGMGIRLLFLSGSVRNKKELYKKIKEGEADIIIGTHAVIQKDVEFSNLGLVVVDEQHRFGVAQRAELSKKGEKPHTLVMTATPIPRTLALILYGDLDISILNEMPPGRKPVKTYALGENMRDRIDAFLEKNIKNGGQCYVVCPLVEETQKSDLANAEDIRKRLSNKFPDFKVGLVHGRMKAKEKEEVMESFVEGKINILVSTTVIEVGVDVANSNIMVIENAERFGLSQLHQLRGRVGRGREQGYLIMFAKATNMITKRRLETMTKSTDGFYISEQDLLLRGPGDFFGTRQHGLPELKIANLFTDGEVLKEAQEAALMTVMGETEVTPKEKKALYEKINKILTQNLVIN